MKPAKKAAILISIAGAAVLSLLIFGRTVQEPLKVDRSQEKEVILGNMKLTSDAFQNNEMIPSKYTCDGENINPPLTISGVPEDAQSLVLIVDDPDAPVGDWVHWLVWNINPKLEKISEGETPENSVQGITDFGRAEYGGPCPPLGTHRYQFELYALDTIIDLGSNAKKRDLETAMQDHITDQATLVGLYKRE